MLASVAEFQGLHRNFHVATEEKLGKPESVSGSSLKLEKILNTIRNHRRLIPAV
jgi:hypothetical protein